MDDEKKKKNPTQFIYLNMYVQNATVKKTKYKPSTFCELKKHEKRISNNNFSTNYDVCFSSKQTRYK